VITRRRLIKLTVGSIFAPAVAVRAARAQTWPDRPIHLIAPIAAGGPTDTNARILADQLSKVLGQQVVVDNKGGAGTNIGNGFVAHSEPDGYTILYGTSSLSANGALYRALDYSPTGDLAPVSLVAKFPFFMFVSNASAAKTVGEFIALAKEKPGKLIIGSPGTGSGPHLTELLFMQMAQIQMTHAPYRGAAPAFIDLIPGRIDCYFGSGELLTYSRSGQVRVLGTSGANRSPAAPDIPTIAEAGVPGYEVESWQGVFVPARTPVEIVRKMNAAIAKALADPAVVNKLAETAYTTAPCSPDELRKFLQTDTQKWAAIIKAADLKIN
jgi:tripartite-type tricarboxylate transporter receptor subunit TctC